MSPASSPDLEVRLARAEERALLLEITLAAYGQYSRELRPEYWARYREHIRETLGDVGAAEQLVASLEGRPVGTVLLYPPGTSFGDDVPAVMSLELPEVRLLAVSPECRGAGVGRALMNACADRAREAGATGIVLHTMAMMRHARALYESMGFVRAPDLDFSPAEDWHAEGFRCTFRQEDRREEAPAPGPQRERAG